MKKIKINNNDYDVIENYKNALESTNNLEEMITDYFDNYDYIFGDISYGKTRLKGFCDKNNKNVNELNSYDRIGDYIKTYCSYECQYFIIKRNN